MAVLFTNNASSTLVSAITAGQTTITVQASDAAEYASPSGGDWFPLTVVEDVFMEIMRCTGRAGAVLTVTRGQEGTTARAFGIGATVDHRLTALALQALVQDTGDTMTGDLTISKATPTLVLDKAAAGQAAVFAGRKGGVARWDMHFGNVTAEGGSNAGSDFALNRYSDAGAYIDTPLVITRSTGSMTLAGSSLTIDSVNPALVLNKKATAQTCTIWTANNGTLRWGLVATTGDAESGGNTGSNFAINRYTDAGAYIDAPLGINRANGAVNFSVAPTIAGQPLPAVATISDTPPSSPVNGQIWFEATTGSLLIYYNDGDSAQWVQINATSG